MWVEELPERTELPYSSTAESAVLGCCMLEQELVDEAGTSLVPDDFYELKHRNLFEVLLRLRDKRIPIDALTIRDEADSSLELGVDGVGGFAFLVGLPDQVPTTSLLAHYSSVVSKQARLRNLVSGARELISKATAKVGDDDAKLDEVEQTLTALMQRTTQGGEVRLTDVVRDAISEIEKAHASDGTCTGIPTGFAALDRTISGFHDGDMTIIAGRPSMGKTSLAVSIVENIAIDQGIPCGIFSLEMTAASLVKRMISSRSGVGGHEILTGNLNEKDIKAITVAASRINGSPIFIDDTPGLTVSSLSSRARRMVARHGVRIIFVDYIQLMHAKADNRQREVSIISGGLKAISKELGIPVIVLSQLNRMVEAQDRPPRLSDLRDSGSIEQDADVVVLLHRPSANTNIVEAMIKKHRNGPTGIADLEFDKEHTRFRTPTP
jgi:replicative DNA helicase